MFVSDVSVFLRLVEFLGVGMLAFGSLSCVFCERSLKVFCMLVVRCRFLFVHSRVLQSSRLYVQVAGEACQGLLTGLVSPEDHRLEITNCFPTARSEPVLDASFFRSVFVVVKIEQSCGVY